MWQDIKGFMFIVMVIAFLVFIITNKDKINKTK